jgi:hypothetical protein
MPNMGDTIKLTVQFVDYDKQPYEATDITFKVFDYSNTQIGDTVSIGSSYRVDVGKYVFYYTIPLDLESNKTKIKVQFTATVDGYQQVVSKSIDVEFAS